MVEPPSPEAVREALARLAPHVIRTPSVPWSGAAARESLGGAEVFLKLELFQVTGTFKPRGALLRLMAATPEERARGVTAVSAGNHALAVAQAARALGLDARIAMTRNANPLRVEGVRRLGAEVVPCHTIHAAFVEARRIAETEGRILVHPFEGPEIVLGTAGVGLELCEDVPELDAVVVPIGGGGGLCAGVASAVKALAPDARVYGVEPEGADSMHRSFAAGEPASIPAVTTIADSLGAPYALPHTFELCRRLVDRLVKVSDDQLVSAMRLLFLECKLAVEPAGAASTAALFGPLREELAGKRVGLIVCGANIDVDSWTRLVTIAPGG